MLGRVKKLASLTCEKSTIPTKYATIYPAITPIRIGIILKNPLNNTFPNTTTARVTIDTITHVPLNSAVLLPPTGKPAISAAELASSSPIIATIEPIAAGGNNLLIHPVPVNLTIIAIRVNTSPVATKPPWIVLKSYPSPISNNTGERYAKLEPKYAGIFPFVINAYKSVPIPLKNNTVVGSILNIIGTKIEEPNIANKC